MLRIVSSAVLAPLAVGIAWLGGWPFFAFWTLAACGVLCEWRTIIADRAAVHVGLGECAVGAAGIAAMVGFGGVAALIVLYGAVVEWLAARARPVRFWVAAGIVYAGALPVACILLRSDPRHGLAAMLFLFAITWATDICAYFVGRLVGGPKLWRRISPNKTWSGAIGGACGAVVAALAVAHVAEIANSLAVSGLALLLSVASQVGDLFESAFKRRFGVKDASHVIPGHGGIMDRLDGFLAAAVLAAVIGVARGGMDAPARGLLVW
ncbi:MAG TPA: CDP-archaeol synthase [Xanthobacteraceae bacterium]|nr:CDP-archaeol synthase [Xanthobacteraceae bacterium]